jgi:transposase
MTTVTVLSGPERQRRWPASEKARIVAASFARGVAVTEVARRHDVHPNLLHHWRRQAKRAAEAGGGLKLLPVTVSAAATRSPTSGAIELGGAVRVRVYASGGGHGIGS